MVTKELLQVSIAFFIGIIAVFYSIPIIVRISIEKHLFDVPNKRKVNKTVVPNLGGIALFIGITIGTLIGMFNDIFHDWRYISVSMIILFFIGLKDDILIISAHKKFVAQLICAFILIVLGDIRLTNLHGIIGINEINYSVSILVSFLAIVAMINAINLIDGIDGLASAIAILACSIFGLNFFLLENIPYAILCFSTVGSLISFFFFNVFGRKNKIFMGDTGSLLLGILLSVIVIRYNEMPVALGQQQGFSAIFSLAIMSVPLFDMVRLFSLRIYNRKSPFSPDMNHIHHKFLKLGFSHLKSTSLIFLYNLFIIISIYIFRDQETFVLLTILLILNSVLMIVPGRIYAYRQSRIEEKESQPGKIIISHTPKHLSVKAIIHPEELPKKEMVEPKKVYE